MDMFFEGVRLRFENIPAQKYPIYYSFKNDLNIHIDKKYASFLHNRMRALFIGEESALYFWSSDETGINRRDMIIDCVKEFCNYYKIPLKINGKPYGSKSKLGRL